MFGWVQNIPAIANTRNFHHWSQKSNRHFRPGWLFNKTRLLKCNNDYYVKILSSFLNLPKFCKYCWDTVRRLFPEEAFKQHQFNHNLIHKVIDKSHCLLLPQKDTSMALCSFDIQRSTLLFLQNAQHLNVFPCGSNWFTVLCSRVEPFFICASSIR